MIFLPLASRPIFIDLVHCFQVRWAHENYHHDVEAPYNLRLAAADQAGHVMIWDAVSAKLLNDFVESGLCYSPIYVLRCVIGMTRNLLSSRCFPSQHCKQHN